MGRRRYPARPGRTKFLRPILLQADNFTPPARTPWGGTRILDLKRDAPLDAAKRGYAVVGESWELSVEPDFPGTAEDGTPLARLIASDPIGWLGDDGRAGKSSTALLVKLLDADDDLSVQIHPADDYAGLAPAESGKPESWYVLEARDGGGLYLGLKNGVTRDAMARAIEAGEDVSRLLFFTPVAPGDFFAIEAGTAHAIGRGVTLVEPQRVAPGRRGVTYRYWDWNRRYDEAGRLDPGGKPRALHVDHALCVTRWDAEREEALLARIRHRAGAPAAAAPPERRPLGGPAGPVLFPSLRVDRLTGNGRLPLAPEPRLRGLTVVGGTVRLRGDGFDVEVAAGRSAVLPAGLGPVRCDLGLAHAVLSAA
jgi:mannose-6-phosphate isomerase